MSLLIFIAAHGYGQGVVIWVFISEIFPNRVRAPADLWQLHALGRKRQRFLDISRHRGSRRLDGIRVLRRVHGRAVGLVCYGDAGDERHLARKDSGRVGH